MAGSLSLYERPQLVDPILIMGLSGYNDPAGVVTDSIQHMHAHFKPTKIGEIGGSRFYIHSLTPPTGIIREGRVERRVFPRTHVYAWENYQTPRHDLIIVSGDEPDLNWDKYAESVVGLSKEFGVEDVFMLGARHTNMPHTRGARLFAVYNNPLLRDTLERAGVRPVRDYEGPLDVRDIMVASASARNINAVGIWASVPPYWGYSNYMPFYVNTPYSRGSHALLKAVQEMTGLDFDIAILKDRADETERAANEFISRDPQFQEILAELENEHDAEERYERTDEMLRMALERNHPIGSG